MIVVLAGRRVDAPNAPEARFPLTNVQSVKEKLQQFFRENNVRCFISSGACGADLLAMEVAGELSIPRKMVLPFEAEIFRSTSVADRPGDWGKIFDKVYKELRQQANVVQLGYDKDEDDVYEKTNFDILNTAGEISEAIKDDQKVAIIVWEGYPKDENDTTDHFRKEAREQGYMIEEINSLHK